MSPGNGQIERGHTTYAKPLKNYLSPYNFKLPKENDVDEKKAPI